MISMHWFRKELSVYIVSVKVGLVKIHKNYIKFFQKYFFVPKMLHFKIAYVKCNKNIYAILNEKIILLQTLSY